MELSALLQTSGPLTATEPTRKTTATIPADRQRDALWLDGWAMGFGQQYKAGNHYHHQICEPKTFERWAKTLQSRLAPVLVGHNESWAVPTLGPTLWSPRVYGLRVAFAVDISTSRGRAAAEAVRRNWLTGLSIHMRWHDRNSDLVFDSKAGRCHRVINVARAAEVSLTNKPAAPRTSIGIAGADDWGDEPVKSIPTNKSDARAMIRLLSAFGVHDNGEAREESMADLSIVADRQRVMMQADKPRW